MDECDRVETSRYFPYVDVMYTRTRASLFSVEQGKGTYLSSHSRQRWKTRQTGAPVRCAKARRTALFAWTKFRGRKRLGAFTLFAPSASTRFSS